MYLNCFWINLKIDKSSLSLIYKYFLFYTVFKIKDSPTVNNFLQRVRWGQQMVVISWKQVLTITNGYLWTERFKKGLHTLSACLDGVLRKRTHTYGVDHHTLQRQTEQTHYRTKRQAACRRGGFRQRSMTAVRREYAGKQRTMDSKFFSFVLF